MADIIRQTKTLSLEAEFIDGDTRTITLDNPKDTLTAADIDATATIMTKTLVGDKLGAQFYRWKTAAIINKQSIIFDISGE